ncbi:MAG: DUF6514 family protein [Oscillospiraceae bacterium]
MKTCLVLENASGQLKYVLGESNGTYGISISCSLFGKEQYLSVEDITSNYDKAYIMVNMLADYAALPSNAKEIIENMLVEYSFM